jgi:hypothetical protein
MRERRNIGLLYSWHTNEYILLGWALSLGVAWFAFAGLWLLRLACLGRGPGRWAAEALSRLAQQRAESGSWFAFTPAYAWHHRQVIRFQLLYLLFIACTCGIGLLLGAPFYIAWFMRARREAEAGGWPLLPIVGRWQPEPPSDAVG